MATNNPERDERVRALVAALLAEEQAAKKATVRETINDIEDAMVRIGNRVAREVGVQKLAPHTDPERSEACCPTCGHVGEHVGKQDRELITRRGQVPLTEAKYRCRKCRRHFFPSEQVVGA